MFKYLSNRVFGFACLLVALWVPNISLATPKLGERFGDWTYGCSGKDDKKDNCFLSQTIVEKTTNKSVLILQLARNEQSKDLVLTAILPLGIHFPANVMASIDGKEAFKFTLLSCLNIGCIGTYAPDRGGKSALNMGKALDIKFSVDAGKRPVTLRASLVGLADAVKATF
jgi:invasion protein IalB